MAEAYQFNEFVAACATTTIWVHVTGGALETASAYFNLMTALAVQEFIGNGGLEHVAYIRTAPFENWRGPPPAPLVDSYRFQSGPSKRGYLAFFVNHKNQYVIKSLKKDDRFGGFYQLAAALALKRPE
jgi:hypothetical protein